MIIALTILFYYSQFGRSALTIACEHGNLTLVEFLIEKGANVKGTVKVATITITCIKCVDYVTTQPTNT